MWKRRPETTVCPTCNMVHQPDAPTGEFRLYCRTHRRPLEKAAERRYNVLQWVDRNFDKVAKLYDEHVAAMNAAYSSRNFGAPASADLDAYGLGAAQPQGRSAEWGRGEPDA